MALRPVRERFDEKVSPEPNTGCHLWTGSVDHRGYGWIRINRKSIKAHRWAFESQSGPIPAGMFVCHRCYQPACVNVAHMFLGTPADNHRDMVAKKRHAVGQSLPQSKLTDADVLELRRLHATGMFSVRELAKRFGITHMPAQSIVNRKTWKHINGEVGYRVHI